MYRSLRFLRLNQPESFDEPFDSHAHYDGDWLRFIKTRDTQRYSVPGVMGRMVWDVSCRRLDATYLLPRPALGLVTGVMAEKMQPVDDAGITAIGLTSVGAEHDSTRLVFGNTLPDAPPGTEGVEPSITLPEYLHSYLLDDHFDTFVFPKLLRFAGLETPATVLQDID